MISLEDSGHAWRTCLCGVLDTKHDYDDSQVAALFEEAGAWARDRKIGFDPEAEYLTEYLASRDNGEPKIPQHVRLYCAHLSDLRVELPAPPAAHPRSNVAERRKLPERKTRHKEPYHRRAAVR